MAVRNNGGCRRFHSRQDSIPELPAAPSSSEPAMRRWPHPTAAPPQPEATGAELYSIGCALSQQTQLLTEIRTLLERLAPQGCLSLHCYTGHEGGAAEEAALAQRLARLEPRRWRVLHCRDANRETHGESILLAERLPVRQR